MILKKYIKRLVEQFENQNELSKFIIILSLEHKKF